MRAVWGIVAAIVLSLGVSACSTLDDLNPFSDSEPAQASNASSASGSAAADVAKIPVVRIDNLELGRLFRGYMLIAEGVAPGTGYYDPELRIRYGGELGPDGFYEFDFVAVPPTDPRQGSDAPITARILRGDYELSPRMLRSARGVRVWSSRDSVEGRF